MKSLKQRWREAINEHYTLGEEILHSLTHGMGAVLSVVALVALIVLAAQRGTAAHVISYSIYGASMVALFLASTLYHGVQKPRLRPLLRRVDHSAIYLLIAGTYTPFVLISLRSSLGFTLLAVVWGLAVFGIVYKIFFIDRYAVITTLAYVVMGWLSIIAWREMVATIPPVGLSFLVAGGVLYTVGVIFYALTRVRYTHAVWHVFILGAAACHFVAVLTLLNV